MARPLEFDRDEALEAALKLFWSQGYTATSLQQLLSAMNLSRSSFYASFIDKRALFVEVLELFHTRTLALLQTDWERDKSLRAIPRFFEKTLLKAPPRRSGRGCMMVNTILELADVDLELSQLAADRLSAMEACFETIFAHAMAAGEYSRERSPRELAETVMLINQGLRVASRKRVHRDVLRRNVDNSMALLGLAG